MQHLTEEQLVAHFYRDAEAPPEASAHLIECRDCGDQYEMLRRVLALVDELPVPDRGEHYGEQVWTRLRWRLGRRTRRTWLSLAAAAALFVIAFIAGGYWHAKHAAGNADDQMARKMNVPAPAGPAQAKDHVLVFVVTDHLDNTARMLLTVANADPGKGLDLTSEQARAVELVASNRIYRQTASQRGDARIVSLLSDIEPILVELSHAGTSLNAEQLASMQKRIEEKGLLFKVRVMSAQAGGEDAPHALGPSSL
jgi:hypothetical protein